MCRYISTGDLDPRARSELGYLSRETGIRVIDGGAYDDEEELPEVVPKKKAKTEKVVVPTRRALPSFRLSGGMLSKKTKRIKKGRK